MYFPALSTVICLIPRLAPVLYFTALRTVRMSHPIFQLLSPQPYYVIHVIPCLAPFVYFASLDAVCMFSRAKHRLVVPPSPDSDLQCNPNRPPRQNYKANFHGYRRFWTHRGLQNMNWSRRICSHFIVLILTSDWLIWKFSLHFLSGWLCGSCSCIVTVSFSDSFDVIYS